MEESTLEAPVFGTNDFFKNKEKERNFFDLI